MNNKVSVIIPTFNGSTTIKETLLSILRQSYTNYEIIVVDDGSTDLTVDIVRAFLPSAKIIQQQNRGTMAARQAGIEAAEGDLIALLDQDDQWYLESLHEEVAVIEKDPGIGLVLANMKAVDDNGKLLGFNVVPDSHCYTPTWEELLLLHPIANSTTLFQRNIMDKIVALDVNFGFSGALGDSDTVLRMSEVTKIHFLNQCLGNYRWSETRPGRLVSFLDNLQIYAKKHWNHPSLQNNATVGLQDKFVQTCCNYALHIYRLLLNQYKGRIPFELIIKLNDHHKFMEDLFGEFYRTNIGLKYLEISIMDSKNDGLNILLFLYLLRLDLQRAFPEVVSGDLERIIVWGANAADGEIPDGDFEVLRQFSIDLQMLLETANYAQPLTIAKSKSEITNKGSGQTKKKKLPIKTRLQTRIYIYLSSVSKMILPMGSKRRRLLSPVIKGIKILLTEGWGSFWSKSIHYIEKWTYFFKKKFKRQVRANNIRTDGQREIFEDLAKIKMSILLSDLRAKLTFPQYDIPYVAIVLEINGNQKYLYECLESLLAYTNLPFHLFLVCNKADTETKIFLSKLVNVTVVEKPDDHQYESNSYKMLRNHFSKEKYILFISDDIVVTSGYLENMLRIIESDYHCGAVGCKIISISGRLVEAGGIIRDDNASLSYGFGDVPSKPEYSYVRDIQSTSPKCFMVKKELLDEIFSNNQSFMPQVEICKLIKDKGYRLKYQPASIVLSRYIENLSTHIVITPVQKSTRQNNAKLLSSRSAIKSARILVIDDYIPAIHYGSGFPRLFEMLTCLTDLGYSVTFLPVGNPVRAEPETFELQQKGIEVFWDSYADLEAIVEARVGFYDMVLISRPHVFERISSTIRKKFPESIVLYDAEALFYTREIMKSKILGVTVPKDKELQMAQSEMKSIEAADLVIAVSQKTKEIMQKFSSQRYIEIWEHIQDVNDTPSSFIQRNGILFFGSFFAGPGSPNEDAAIYFVEEILPIICEIQPHKLFVVGGHPTPSVKALASPYIEVTGYVDDIRNYCETCRVNVVPTRFAAGIPLKLLEAMSYGIPSVVSGLIADQLGLSDRKQVLVANNSQEFAEKVTRLYTDENLWYEIKRNSLDYIKNNYSRTIMREKLNFIINKGLELGIKKRNGKLGNEL